MTLQFPDGVFEAAGNPEFVEVSNDVQEEEARLNSFHLLQLISARKRGVGKAGNEEDGWCG